MPATIVASPRRGEGLGEVASDVVMLQTCSGMLRLMSAFLRVDRSFNKGAARSECSPRLCCHDPHAPQSTKTAGVITSASILTRRLCRFGIWDSRFLPMTVANGIQPSPGTTASTDTSLHKPSRIARGRRRWNCWSFVRADDFAPFHPDKPYEQSLYRATVYLAGGFARTRNSH